MFEVGWTEMLVIAVVMIVVVGPKDLPNMLRTMGRMTSKMRGMANDFRRQFDEALKEAELDDVKKSVDSLRGLNPATEIRKQLNPFEKAAADVRAGLDQAMKPKPAPEPKVAEADAPAEPAEPLKNGATEMPGVAGPDAMPSAPAIASATADATAKAAPAVKAKTATKTVKAPAAKPGKSAAVAAGKVAKSPAKVAAPKAAATGKAVANAPAAKVARPAAAGKAAAVSKAAKPGKAASRKRAGS